MGQYNHISCKYTINILAMAYVPLQLVESGGKCGEDCEADSSLQLPGMISMHCY